MTLTFNVMTYWHAKVQGQRSVAFEDRVEQTDGRTEGGDCNTCRINAIGKHAVYLMRLFVSLACCTRETFPSTPISYFTASRSVFRHSAATASVVRDPLPVI